MTITSSIGLISGIDTKALIDQLIALESRPKALVQQRNTAIKTTQVALNEVSANILSFKLSLAGLTSGTSFDATASTSSDETAIAVTSSKDATPGTYNFTVKQLVGTQTTVTRGLTDAAFTKLAPQGTTLTFDRGEAKLSRSSSLSALNGGAGIARGLIRITDRSGASALVDLRAVASIDDVINKINESTTVSVFAELSGDSIKINDLSGATTGNLTVADVGVSAAGGTATSLGIAGSVAADNLTGTAINSLGRGTLLSSLNDGTGVRTFSGGDLKITAADGTVANVTVNGLTNVGELIDAVDTATAGKVTLAVDGGRFKLTDNTGGGGTLAVAAFSTSKAAVDLGLLGSDGDGDGEIAGLRVLAGFNSKLLKNLNGGQGVAGLAGSTQVALTPATNLADLFASTGITGEGTTATDIRITARDGTEVEVDVDSVAGGTVQDLLDLVNNATDKVTLAIDGQKLVLRDVTGSETSKLKVANLNNATTATQLGLVVNADAQRVRSKDLNPTGTADTAATIRVTNRAGGSFDVDLLGSESVSDVIDKINAASTAANAKVVASLNAAGTGLQLADATGDNGTLSVTDVSGNAAASLRLNKSVASSTLDTGSLQYRYLTEATRLDTLGVTRGQFKITDSSGQQATIDLTQGNELTLDDVMREINSRGIAVNARINDDGNGIVLEDTGLKSFAIKVEEDGSTTARDLGLLGAATAAGNDLDGSFSRSVAVSGSDTLKSIATKIAAAEIGINATVINDGSEGAPYRLSLQGDKAGKAGAFVFDDGGLGLASTNVAEAQDAVVFFGSADPAKALAVTSSSNRLDRLVPGVTVDLLKTTDEPVTVTVSRDDEGLIAAAEVFVTSFNRVISTIDKYDKYNADTNVRGVLLGDPTVTTARNRLYSLITQRNNELTSQYGALSQIGIRVVNGGSLSLDRDRFLDALANDREAVKNLFTFKEEDDGDLIAGGVGARLDDYLERLTDTTSGDFQRRNDTLNDQVEANNQRIKRMDGLLAAKRERLEKQFAAMETALAKMQDQSSALAGLSNIAAQARRSASS